MRADSSWGRREGDVLGREEKKKKKRKEREREREKEEEKKISSSWLGFTKPGFSPYSFFHIEISFK